MPAPKSTEKKAALSLIEEFKSLMETSIRGNMQLISRVNELVKTAGKSLGPDRKKNDGTQSSPLIRILGFSLASYSVLSACALEMLNGLVSAAEHSLLGKDTATPEAASPQVCGEIHVETRQGERLKAPFLVENQYSTPLDISFEASDLIASAAPALPSSHIAFEPAALVLGPQEKAVIIALIDISKAFVAGQTYTSTIRVLGFQGKEVRLVLTILPPTETARPAVKAKPKKQTKTARRHKPSAKA
jgi:hypothetical protein